MKATGRDGALSAVKPLFIAQIAAWVRLLTSILRSSVLRWTLTVASVMPSLYGDHLVAGAGHQRLEDFLLARRQAAD